MHLPSFIYVVEMITVLGGTANPRVPELNPEQQITWVIPFPPRARESRVHPGEFSGRA